MARECQLNIQRSPVSKVRLSNPGMKGMGRVAAGSTRLIQQGHILISEMESLPKQNLLPWCLKSWLTSGQCSCPLSFSLGCDSIGLICSPDGFYTGNPSGEQINPIESHPGQALCQKDKHNHFNIRMHKVERFVEKPFMLSNHLLPFRAVLLVIAINSLTCKLYASECFVQS